MTLQRVGVKTAVDCVLEAVDPYREVLLFVIRGESVDFNLLAILDLRTTSVIRIGVAIVFCGEITFPIAMSSPLRTSSYGAAT